MFIDHFLLLFFKGKYNKAWDSLKKTHENEDIRNEIEIMIKYFRIAANAHNTRDVEVRAKCNLRRK